MKKILLGTVGLMALGLATSANAADLRGRAPVYKAPVAVAMVYNWTGFYIGGQVGGLWGTTDAVSGPFPGLINQSYSYNLSGVAGGLHAGYNFQFSNLVVGAEADIEASSVDNTGIGTLGYTHQTRMPWLGSVRARAGYAMGNTLLYATGGWAYGHVEITKAVAPGAAPFAQFDDTRSGWTVGGGVEHAFAPNWTGRIEYRYTDLGTTDFTSVAANSQDSSTVKFHAVRAGISYKFGGPVVARY